MFNIYLVCRNQNCTMIDKHYEVKTWIDMAKKQGFKYTVLSLFPPLGTSGRIRMDWTCLWQINKSIEDK